jgi:hypothetical protein
MHLVGELHSGELCLDLCSRQFPKVFRDDKSSIEGNRAPDAGGESRDDALLTQVAQFSRSYFLQDFMQI